MKHYIDLNSDMGESFGNYRLGLDDKVMDYVSSANIACGFHAGDPMVMKRTVQMAIEKGVRPGAHPGFRDLVGFGRRPMRLSPEEIYNDVLYQVGALKAFCDSLGVPLQHVKAHGALYNMASVDAAMAEAIASAVYDLDPNLILFALLGSELAEAGKKKGLRVAHETFADRAFQEDGTLLPRTEPGAVIHDAGLAASRVVRMVREGKVTAVTGVDIDVSPETICVHGDNPAALEVLKEIRRRLDEAGIAVRPVSEGFPR